MTTNEKDTMTDQSIEKSAAEVVLERAVKGGFQSVQKLLDSLDQASKASDLDARQKDSKVVRQAEWTKALDTIPMDQIQALQDNLTTYVDKYVLARLEVSEPRELTTQEVDQLAAEYKAWQALDDFLTARKGQFRSIVFAALNAKYDAQIKASGMVTDTPPEQMPGEIYSEAMGIRFKREGGARKAPAINWDYLKATLSPEVWADVCDQVKVPRQIVPAHIDFIPNEEKLMDVINTGDVPLETLREALVPGAWTTPRFVPRKA
jgi:hypothetical protein